MQWSVTIPLLPPAYVVRGKVMFWHASVHPSICLSTGGVPISHNALQHFPECHEVAGGGGTQVGQQKEYSLHGGRYASCVHAGGLSCFLYGKCFTTPQFHWWLVEVPYWFTDGFLCKIFRIFPMQNLKYYFTQSDMYARQGWTDARWEWDKHHENLKNWICFSHV